MKIAILGWGSLIWKPEELKYNKELDWNKEGPYLPLEFSRISSDGRLTLVIDKNSQKVQTLYSVSLYEKLDEAISDLAIRENCSKDKIGRYIKQDNESFPKDFNCHKDICEWIKATDFDAVVWTNLAKKFKDKTGLTHNTENVINYLQTLPQEVKVIAEEYIRKVPSQVNTEIRRQIEDKLGWTLIQHI